MEGYQRPERRKYPRLQESLPLLYKTIDLKETFRVLNELIQTKAENISGGGLMFRSNQPLEEGALLAMQVNKDVFSPVHLMGKVVRSKKLENENIYQIGIQFTDLKDECRNELTYFIEEQLKLSQEGVVTTSIIAEDKIPFETIAAKEIIFFLKHTLDKEGIYIDLVEEEGCHFITVRKKLGIKYGRNP